MDSRALSDDKKLFISPKHLNTPLTLILYDQLQWKHSVLEKSGCMRTRQMFSLHALLLLAEV